MADVEQTISGSETIISIKDSPPSALIARRRRQKSRNGSWVKHKTPRRKSSTRFGDRLRKSYMIVYGICIGLVGWKFQCEKLSPFKTQSFFCYLSPIAFCITISVFWVLFDAKNIFKYSDTLHKILTHVVCLSGILAQLSLLLLYFIPPKLNWVGYTILSGFFLAMVAYTLRDHIMLLCKKISEIWERIKAFKQNKISSLTTRSV